MILPFLPDPQMAQYRASFESRLASMVGRLSPELLGGTLTPLIREQAAATFTAANATEGTIWSIAEDHAHLVPVLNTGPNAKAFIERARQPLNAGLISMVFVAGMTVAESNVYLNQKHDRTVAQLTNEATCSMIAVRFSVFGSPRGVISCVKNKDTDSLDPDPPPFDLEAVTAMERLATLIGRLIEWKLASITLGIDHE